MWEKSGNLGIGAGFRDARGLRRRSPILWARQQDIRCQPRTRSAAGADATAAILDPDAAAGDDHAHRLADEPRRHAIGVGVDLDRAIGLDALEGGSRCGIGSSEVPRPSLADYVTGMKPTGGAIASEGG